MKWVQETRKEMEVALPRDMVMEIEEDRVKIAFGGTAIWIC